MKTTIRVSALPGYPDCPRRGAARLFSRLVGAAGFRLRYMPRSIAGLVGTAVHRGAAVMLQQKARAGSLPSRDFAVEAARENLRTGAENGDIIFDTANGPTRNMADAVDQTVAMATVYHKLIAPAVNPIIVEERLEASIGPDLILSGQPDLVAREPNAIRDLKTGVREPTSVAAQLGGYSLLARSHNLPIELASIDFIRRVRRGRPQPDPIKASAVVAHAEAAAMATIKHIQGDLRTFTEGDPVRKIRPGDPWAFAANPASTLCSAKYCCAYGTSFCREGALARGEKSDG